MIATAIAAQAAQQATQPRLSATVYCLVQNRHGALDRVLHAWTHRGIIPQQFLSTKDERANTLQIMVSFDIEDAKALEKLVKCLNKQVYVLDAHAESESVVYAAESVEDSRLSEAAKIAALFTPGYKSAQGQ